MRDSTQFDQLEPAFLKANRLYRTQVFALKQDANDLAAAAAKTGKEKSASKPTRDAAKAIGVAVHAYERHRRPRAGQRQAGTAPARRQGPHQGTRNRSPHGP